MFTLYIKLYVDKLKSLNFKLTYFRETLEKMNKFEINIFGQKLKKKRMQKYLLEVIILILISVQFCT